MKFAPLCLFSSELVLLFFFSAGEPVVPMIRLLNMETLATAHHSSVIAQVLLTYCVDEGFWLLYSNEIR